MSQQNGRQNSPPGPKAPVPPGGPDQWERVCEEVNHLVTVAGSAKKCGFWPYRDPLSRAVDRLEEETKIEVEFLPIDSETTHLDSPSTSPEWTEFVHKIQDVVLMEEVLRQHCYQQCIQPFLTAVNRLCAAVMIPESDDGECPSSDRPVSSDRQPRK